MQQSLFIEYVKKYFPGIVVNVVEKLNDTKRQLPYYHRQYLGKDFSVSGKWESISGKNKLVAADVVSIDSPLPLKNRGSLSRANGDIVKIGMELYMNETELTAIDTLIATNSNNSNIKQIIQKLFQDTPKVISGVYERLEQMFLEGLSTGVTLIEDDENVGTGVRLDYGFLDENKFTAGTTSWDTVASATPFDDIKKVLDKARDDGNMVTKVLTDSETIDKICKTAQAKELYAFNVGFVGNKIPVPDLQMINKMTMSRYGFEFVPIDRSVRIQKNGIDTVVKPWAAGSLCFITNDRVGDLVYARLAEESHPVAGVQYQKADDFILVSKYRQNKPALSEYTSSQARVVPVISNVDQIYLLDSTTTA